MSADLSDLLAERADDLDGVAPAATTGAAAPPAPSDWAISADAYSQHRAAQLCAAEDNRPAVADRDDARTLLAESHSALFDPQPKVAGEDESLTPTAARRAIFWREMFARPDIAGARVHTVLNDSTTSLAAQGIAARLAEFLTETEPPEGDCPGDNPGDVQGTQLAAIKAARDAAQNAAETTDQAHSLAAGLGDGDGGALNNAKLAEMFIAARNNPRLRAILDRLGRYLALAATKQRTKTRSHGYDDCVGVTLSGDLDRAVPAELLSLCLPALRLDALRRWAERQLVSYELRGTKPLQRGPIVVCVDESGSMDGNPIACAKALALSLAWVARQQKRYICLTSFNQRLIGDPLVIRPGETRHDEVLAWAARLQGGGTTLTGPCDELPARWNSLGCPRGKTDLLILTDCVVDAPPSLVASFAKWRADHEVIARGIAIGAEVGVLASICDESWSLPDLDISHEAISQILGV